MSDTPRTELERLEALEWAGQIWTYDQGHPCCPVCDDEPPSAHAPDCWLAARIAELRAGASKVVLEFTEDDVAPR